MHYTPQQRIDLIAKGKCPFCPQNRPLAKGKHSCEICRKRNNVNKQAQRRRHGFGKLVCNSCGKVPPEPGYSRCHECRLYDIVVSKQIRTRRNSENRCVKCGRMLSETEVIVGNRVCFSCTERMIMIGKI